MMVKQAIRNCHRFSHGQQTHIFSSSAYFFVHSVILINVGKVSTKLAQRKRHYLHVYATIARQVGRSVSKVKPLKYSIESVALGRQVGKGRLLDRQFLVVFYQTKPSCFCCGQFSKHFYRRTKTFRRDTNISRFRLSQFGFCCLPSTFLGFFRDM